MAVFAYSAMADLLLPQRREATAQMPQSKAPPYFCRPLTESTAACIMMNNGTFGVDHYEIKPVSPYLETAFCKHVEVSCAFCAEKSNRVLTTLGIPKLT